MPVPNYDIIVKSNFFFSTFKKFSFQLISAVCIQHKVGHFCYSLQFNVSVVTAVTTLTDRSSGYTLFIIIQEA